MAEVELVFLGTGGGRFATITQKRKTGGIRYLSKSLNMHLDPGPGALIYSLEMGLNPQKIMAVLVSHSHPDHYTNAEILIEAMTRGMLKKRGIVAAPHSVLFGNEETGPAISRYHQKMPEKVIEVKPGVVFHVGDTRIVATEAKHSDLDAVGFRFETQEVGDIAYTSDTEYFEGVGKAYEGVRLLILCVMRPSGNPWMGHMTPEDAIKIVEEVKPEMAVATHFGMKMIFSGPNRQVKLIEEKTGVPTLAAFDGMRLRVGEKIRVERTGRKQSGLEEFLKHG
ncbi:MBL fold metallo-hydrolase [Candidatus Bathyarchaeota archaeon]|nr:MBL fold metallo-hydrolase [Candidatus Bathyarchaeota archaeon]